MDLSPPPPGPASPTPAAPAAHPTDLPCPSGLTLVLLWLAPWGFYLTTLVLTTLSKRFFWSVRDQVFPLLPLAVFLVWVAARLVIAAKMNGAVLLVAVVFLELITAAALLFISALFVVGASVPAPTG